MNSRLPKTNIPSIFHHNVTTYDNRDRIQQEFVKSSANLLLQNMNKCNYIFLSNSKWSDYKTLLEDLYDACNLCVENMQLKSNKEIDRQNQSKEEINEKRLRKYKIVEGKKDDTIQAIYQPLYLKLLDNKPYEFLIVTPDDIDKWTDSKIKNDETKDASRKRRQRFRDNMIFSKIAYTSYLWYMGTDSSSSIII